MPVDEEEIEPADANTYRPFKVMDSTIMKHIVSEVEALGEPEVEGTAYFLNIYARLITRLVRTHWLCGGFNKSDMLWVFSPAIIRH